MKKKTVLIFTAAIFFAACTSHTKGPTSGLFQVSLLDQNGFSELISSKDKLAEFASVDFTGELQPYKKVSRLFKDKEGKSSGIVTSYYPSGQVRQYLEIKQGRAFGLYREWHPSGHLKVKVQVVGGAADLDALSEKTWIFDGVSKAFNSQGELLAEITYAKGILEGPQAYYYPGGAIKCRRHFDKGLKSGKETTFYPKGGIHAWMTYVEGRPEGISKHFWENGQQAGYEVWHEGVLKEGRYTDEEGHFLNEVQEGAGQRIFVTQTGLITRSNYKEGSVSGRVDELDKDWQCTHFYHVQNGLKHGKEVFLFGPGLGPKLEIIWMKGLIHGEQKTWYPSGQIESIREHSKNKKSGHTSAWYADGSLMLTEEYQKDKLIAGRYYAKGTSKVVSEVKSGSGLATLFDSEGNFDSSVRYENNEPVLD